MSQPILTINLQRGYRLVNNDLQANQAVQQGQGITLQLQPGDLILVREKPGPFRQKGPCSPEKKCQHRLPEVDPWIGVVDFLENVQISGCLNLAMASAIYLGSVGPSTTCLENLYFANLEANLEAHPQRHRGCLYQEDEIMVLHRRPWASKVE